jgi:hypothetical protein
LILGRNSGTTWAGSYPTWLLPVRHRPEPGIYRKIDHAPGVHQDAFLSKPCCLFLEAPTPGQGYMAIGAYHPPPGEPVDLRAGVQQPCNRTCSPGNAGQGSHSAIAADPAVGYL